MSKIVLICLLLVPGVLWAQKNTRNHTADSIVATLKSQGFVSDYTGTLSQTEKQALESKLKSFDSRKTAQIAVAVIRTVGNNDIIPFGTKLGKKWGVGYKGLNNGILVLVSMETHEMAILTGKGYQKVVSDATCTRIIKDDLTPYFKKGQFYRGLDIAVDDLMTTVKAYKK